MRKITFYRQKRKDGGIRTGVDVGTDTVLSKFNAGDQDQDPTLVWYVDVRAEGPDLPETAEEARDWFSAQKKTVTRTLNSLASELLIGLDASDSPVRKVALVGNSKNRKTKVSVVASVVRRSDAVKFSRILTDIARHWDEYVQGLIAV